MLKAEFEDPLNVAVVEAKRWLSSVDQRPVSPAAKMSTMLEVFDEQLADKRRASRGGGARPSRRVRSPA